MKEGWTKEKEKGGERGEALPHQDGGSETRSIQ